jgi:hypothetical protein
MLNSPDIILKIKTFKTIPKKIFQLVELWEAEKTKKNQEKVLGDLEKELEIFAKDWLNNIRLNGDTPSGVTQDEREFARWAVGHVEIKKLLL